MLDTEKTYIGQVIIVGGGPVGNFAALLTSTIGVPCTVYEKRSDYTRQINLKIQKDFFKNVQNTMNKISRRHDKYLETLNQSINQKKGKILLKNLESGLKEQAIRNGVKYMVGKEVKTFQQVQKVHKNNPIIIDCTGRNSPLRTNQFGTDDQNMKIYNLHHALHINFKAIAPKNFNFQLLYPVLKNTDDLKLGQVIISKKKDSQDSKFAHVTVPLFISDKLSDIIDQKYPNINRTPLKPFSINIKQFTIQQQVEQVIYSLFCALVMEDWQVDWGSVMLKKINITCGYAFNRSKNRYICLGDSAAHFAYFKSLNFGLKHAFQFVKILSTYHSLNYKLNPFEQKDIINKFWKAYPLLWPTKARQSQCPSVYFITTNQLGVLAPYKYNISNGGAQRINLLPMISQQKIQSAFQKYDQQKKELSWQHYLDKFEKIRKFDIDIQIMSNRNKKAGSQVIAYFIWLNGLSPIKLSETVSLMSKGYFLQRKDLIYFSDTMRTVKLSTNNWNNFGQTLKKKFQQIMVQNKDKLPKQYEYFLSGVAKICINQQFKPSNFCEQILAFKWDSKANKYKQITLLYKVLQIIATIISQQSIKQQQLVQKQSLNEKEEIVLN